MHSIANASRFISGAVLKALRLQPAVAQHSGHSTRDPPQPAQAAPATPAFQAAPTKMHQDMALDYTGDADVDFVKHRNPHYQRAIDMAKVVLKHGKDPTIRNMASDIIKAQESEIAQMRA